MVEWYQVLNMSCGKRGTNIDLYCMSLSGLLKQNTIIWVAYKQQKFTSCSSRGWEVQGQGTNSISVWWGLTSSCLFTTSSHSQKNKKPQELSEVSSIRPPIPLMRAPPSWSIHLPKYPLLKPEIRKLGFNIWMLGAHRHCPWFRIFFFIPSFFKCIYF